MMIILFQSVVLMIIFYGPETVTKESEFRGGPCHALHVCFA